MIITQIIIFFISIFLVIIKKNNYNTNNNIFDMNTLNYKRNNNIYNTQYYIKKTDVGLGVEASRSHMASDVAASMPNVEFNVVASRSTMELVAVVS
jgi:hypothetical protein